MLLSSGVASHICCKAAFDVSRNSSHWSWCSEEMEHSSVHRWCEGQAHWRNLSENVRTFLYRRMAIGVGSRSPPVLLCSIADFVSVDDGIARIRFMRWTNGAIGNEPYLMGKIGVQLAAVMTPFTDAKVGATPVPVVDFCSKQVGGTLRCEICTWYLTLLCMYSQF